MTFEKPLGNLRMGAGCQDNQPGDERVELSVPPPTSDRREKAWELNQSPMANELINHANVIKPA